MDGFSLSVASYVVKAKTPRFKCQKMCENQSKSQPFPQKRPAFVELLSGFEPETSSLPNKEKLLQLVVGYFDLLYSIH